jgi:ankyrin repeat protein
MQSWEKEFSNWTHFHLSTDVNVGLRRPARYSGHRRERSTDAKNGQTETVKFLLRNGANPNAKRHDGITALMHASGRGHTQTVKVLLNAGAEADAKYNYGYTPLMFMRNGGTEVVQMLLDAGADVNEKTDNDRSALLIAEEEGHTGIVEMLKNAGAKD